MASKATKRNAYIVDCRMKVGKIESAASGDKVLIRLLNRQCCTCKGAQRVESIAFRTEEV